MKHLVITTGEDALTKPIVDYLVEKCGMQREDIKRVQLDSQVGAEQTITVTLLVRE